MAYGWTDVDLDTIPVERPNGQKFDVCGIVARVYWDDLAGAPELLIETEKHGYLVLDTNDLWIAEIAAAARRKIMSPTMTARIVEEVIDDRLGQREAARERQSEWMRQAAE